MHYKQVNPQQLLPKCFQQPQQSNQVAQMQQKSIKTAKQKPIQAGKVWKMEPKQNWKQLVKETANQKLQRLKGEHFNRKTRTAKIKIWQNYKANNPMDWKPGADKSKKQQIFGTQQHNKWPKQKPICGANGTPWQNGQANSTCKPSQRHYALASSHEATIQDAVSEQRKK